MMAVAVTVMLDGRISGTGTDGVYVPTVTAIFSPNAAVFHATLFGSAGLNGSG